MGDLLVDPVDWKTPSPVVGGKIPCQHHLYQAEIQWKEKETRSENRREGNLQMGLIPHILPLRNQGHSSSRPHSKPTPSAGFQIHLQVDGFEYPSGLPVLQIQAIDLIDPSQLRAAQISKFHQLPPLIHYYRLCYRCTCNQESASLLGVLEYNFIARYWYPAGFLWDCSWLIPLHSNPLASLESSNGIHWWLLIFA